MHIREEAAVAAVVAAAPAMLCYVTRPDAVLMEVEVEAKANGEDCLNQVRATVGTGIPACPREASGPLGCSSRAGRRCTSGPWSVPGTPGSSLLLLAVGSEGEGAWRTRTVGNPRDTAGHIHSVSLKPCTFL